jgi:hypothetical protein
MKFIDLNNIVEVNIYKHHRFDFYPKDRYIMVIKACFSLSITGNNNLVLSIVLEKKILVLLELIEGVVHEDGQRVGSI